MKIALFLVGLCLCSAICFSQNTEVNQKKDTSRELILVLNEEQAHDLSILLQVGKGYLPETNISMKTGIRAMNFGDSLIKQVNSKLLLWKPKTGAERPKTDSLQVKGP